MIRILLYLAMGIGIGGVSGALGIGGGVLLVPVLMWFFGFDYSRAAGTSLAVLVPPIGLLAAWKYYQEGLMDVEAAVWIALAFAAGANLGAAVAPSFPVPVLRLGLGLILIFVAARFMFASDESVASAAVGLGSVAVAWVAYWGLRGLGRKHLAKPDLGQSIRDARGNKPAEVDYHI
jgi:uncharacterized membrane protein YfcA